MLRRETAVVVKESISCATDGMRVSVRYSVASINAIDVFDEKEKVGLFQTGKCCKHARKFTVVMLLEIWIIGYKIREAITT